MAIIYSYPNKATLVDADDILIIDSESINPAKQTKHTSLGSLLTYIDNNLDYDLQQVLTSGATAYAPVGTGWNGIMSLGYNDGVSNIDKLIINSSSSGASVLTINGNTLQQGDHELKFSTSDFILGGGALTATAGNHTIIKSALGQNVSVVPTEDFNVQTDKDIGHQVRNFVGQYSGILDLRATNNVNIDAVGSVLNAEGNSMVLSSDTVTELKAGNNTIVSTDGSINSTVNIGGTVSNNRAAGVFMQAESFLQARTNSGQGKFYIIGGPQSSTDSDYINSVDPHTFMSEIRLGGTAATFNETAGTKLTAGTKGSAGSSGQVLTSGGSGAAASWTNIVDGISWPTDAMIVGNGSNAATFTTGIVAVDVANTQTTLSAGARYNTTAGTGTGSATQSNANIQFGREAMAQVYGAGTHTSSADNLAIGNEALMGNVGVGAACTGNTAIGWQAMKLQDMANTFCSNNVAVGPGALRGAALSSTGVGGDNVAIGALSMDVTAATSARRNVAVGSNSGGALTQGESNIMIGYQAGGTVLTGNDNVLIGSVADLTADHSDATGVGRNVRVAEDALALGHDANAQAGGTIALGSHAVTTNLNTLNINASSLPGPQPNGGLVVAPVGGPIPPAGVGPGDVYVIENVTLPGASGPCNVLCIMP